MENTAFLIHFYQRHLPKTCFLKSTYSLWISSRISTCQEYGSSLGLSYLNKFAQLCQQKIFSDNSYSFQISHQAKPLYQCSKWKTIGEHTLFQPRSCGCKVTPAVYYCPEAFAQRNSFSFKAVVCHITVQRMKLMERLEHLRHKQNKAVKDLTPS